MIKEYQRSEETNFAYFLKQVWRRKWIVLAIALVCAVILGGWTGYRRMSEGENDSETVVTAQMQLFIRDTETKMVVEDHKNNIAGILVNTGNLATVIDEYDLDLPESELSEKIELTTSGSNVLLVSLTIADENVARDVLNRLSQLAIDQYASIFPRVEITQIGDIVIVDEAVLAATSFQIIQSAVKYGLFGFAVGLAVSICVIGLVVLISNKINTAKDLANCVEAPVLSVVANTISGNTLFSGSSDRNDDVQRIAVHLANHAGKLHTVAFIGCTDGDGISTLSREVAVQLAQMNHRVLLVNANLRDADGDTALGVQGNGILECAAGTPVEPQTSKVERLFVLPAGTGDTDPIEALSAPSFQQLLCDAATAYDFVLLDTPALCAHADALLLAKYSDACILIARARKTGFVTMEHAAQQLKLDGSKLLGTVLNRYI